MKRFAFFAMLAAGALAFALGAPAAGGALFAALFCWIAYLTWRRQRFRFIEGRGARESSFELPADPAQAEIAADGSCALFATVDQRIFMLDSRGRQLWARPTEPGTLAYLALPGGACAYAVGDELCLTDAGGATRARLAFDPPPYKQSYRLLLSADGSRLALHTPWFIQMASPDLSALGARVRHEDTGHFMKYAALSPDGKSLFFAGAKLLEDAPNTEARWGCWKEGGQGWAPAWAGSEQSINNSHLRAAGISLDGGTYFVEVYQEGYDFRLFSPDGQLIWKRAGEHLALSPDASWAFFENPIDGVVLSPRGSKTKAWVSKPGERVRHKSVNARGEALWIAGRRLMKTGADGSLLWDAWFHTDPYRFAVSQDGSSFALLCGRKAAMLRVPF